MLRDIRRSAVLPVIMLTALDDLASKVSSLDGGADDYVTSRSISTNWSARIRAVTRRADQRASSSLEFGELANRSAIASRVSRGERHDRTVAARIRFARVFRPQSGQGALSPANI